MTTILDVRAATVRFGGITAVDGLSTTFETGKVHGLVGPNGSGKSTLINAISRITNLTSGELVFADTTYSHWSAARTARGGISRTFQTVRLLPSLTVLENVMTGADARCFSAGILTPLVRMWHSVRAEKAARAAAVEALSRLHIAEVADRSPATLPYGIQRRVEIARSIASDPRLLLLDEPTAGMTRGEKEEIGEVLTELRDEHGISQILVDHDVQLMLDIADTLTVMNFGKLIARGHPADVVDEPAVQEAYLGKGRSA